ncbi:MAG: c-type cytochrome [Verrucomicrobiota bacterium]|nr:c-type cytochrome [Verrucomicrobiota bacterium]
MRWAATIVWLLPLFAAMAQPVVPGYERLMRDTPAELAAAGEVLVNELNCVACHQANKDSRFKFTTAPILFTQHNPPDADWLHHWLKNPHHLKLGTRMPDLMHSMGELEQGLRIAELGHFLATMSPKQVADTAQPGDAKAGKKLYETIGCAQCHAPDAKDNGKDIPLGALAQKYSRGNLVKFLRDPLHSRPAGRMPRFPMTEKEATDLAEFLRARQPKAPLKPFVVKGFSTEQLAARGAGLFVKLRCANCHATGKPFKPPFLWAATSLTKLKLQTETGCLTLKKRPGKGVPFFEFSAEQAKAIIAALRAKPRKETPRTQAHRRMSQLNCTACHTRDGLGQPEAARDRFFLTTGNDLGDEGRLPPLLTGVGAKLTEAALQKVLRGQGGVRPYMTTRMPDFGEAHATMLPKLLADADARANVKPTPRHGNENKVGRNQYGRELMGVKGLSCIACHQLGGRRSLGIQSMDLAHASGRLRPEWFRDYLINPTAFRPGTRMPSFWPEGKAVSKIFGGNTPRQIDSLWVYLNELDQTRLPEGLEKKGGFELKPAKRPIVFRTFMEGAGTHAIAVGFPAGVHAAFDAEAVGWALAWRGKFLDAESTWDNRFTPLAKPLGTNVIKLPPSPAVAVYQDGKPWPKGGLQFRGYRLAKDGTPTFLYRHGKTEITDTLTARGKGLRRRMEFYGGEGELAVRLAIGENFRTKEVGVWITDQQLTIIAPTARVRSIGKQSELLAPVKLKANGKTILEVELQW